MKTDYIQRFKFVGVYDTDPNWPNHTGYTVWQYGMYTIEEHRLGGITAKRVNKLYYGKRKKLLAMCDGKDFNRKWVQEKIDEHKARRR